MSDDRRYVVRAVKFFCSDESGRDFPGSDEPYWIFTGRGPSPEIHTTRSKVFGDVDSGDTRPFEAANDRNVIYPERGATEGGAGPIALSIQLWESDQGDPVETLKQTRRAFDLAAQAPVIGTWVRLVPGIVRDQIIDQVASTIGDDLMGSATLSFPASRLTRQLPSVGARFTQKIHLGGRSGDLPFEIAGGPDYDLFLEVTRVA